MSNAVEQLEMQIKELKKGLFLMSPKDRVRALSSHETDDLIHELQDVADNALKTLEQLKG